MQNNRIDWIDKAKGIATLMVILGHMPIPGFLCVIIYSCHMPLFFMLSGYILRDKGETVGTFCKRKMKALLKPLLQYSIILIIFHFCFYTLIVKSLSVTSVKNEIIGLVIQMKNGGEYSSSLWFLPCMFLAIIIVFLFIRKVKSLKIHIFWTITLGLVGSVVYCFCSSKYSCI